MRHMTRGHARTVAIATHPRVDASDLAPLIHADDGDIVTVSPKVFLACSFLNAAQGKLKKADRAFWSDMATRRGKLRRQTAFAAVGIVGGEAYILDGAKRARAWREGLSKAPDELYVTVHQLMSLAQAETIAAAYQASQRVERSADAVKGAYDAFDMKMTSHRLARGAIGSAIYLAFRGSVFEDDNHPTAAPINLREAVGLIKGELVFLDKLGCSSRTFYSGILAMAIIALAVDPDAKEFIERIAAKRGNKVDGMMDPAESVLHLALITELKEPGRGAAYQAELFSRALRGFDKWRNAKKMPARAYTKGVLTAIDPEPFVREFRAVKGIEDRIDL
ncbi:hypothetical protein [Hyphococcus luteus]|nr:hypothetical protein [Marinicaulis flavus]